MQKSNNQTKLKKIRRYFRNCKLVVVRTSMGNSKPCSKCLKMLKYYGIKKVYYSLEQEIVFEKTNEMETDHLSSRYTHPWREWEQ